MKITLAQLNPTIGDFKTNLLKIKSVLKSLTHQASDLLILSELFPSGYPPQDLLENKDFIDAYMRAIGQLFELSKRYPDIGILCGCIQPSKQKVGKKLYNSALLIKNGIPLFCQNKSLLPTYDVFDETRYFEPATKIDVFKFRGLNLGITICEDIWNDSELFPGTQYQSNPVAELVGKNASLIINISSSPFGIGKAEIRYRLIRNHIEKIKLPFIMVNQVGANDELVFDGNSMAFDQDGNLIAMLPACEESVETIDLDKKQQSILFRSPDPAASVHGALVLGIRDYLRKCHFKKVILGLSGGIDSAIVCCLAVSAIGKENVLGVAMPSQYSSQSSLDDARTLAENLGIDFKIIPITPIYQSYLRSLKEHFENKAEDVTEENIQARIRGNIVMALSNKTGYLTLSTGNKSELSVGYCTLYGDMSGGLSVLADVPKTMVYRLAEFINAKQGNVIPHSIIEKPPSAELKPDQKDQDTLPEYGILDRIIELYLDKGCSKNEIILQGIDEKIVDWTLSAIEKNEFKRRQAAPGLKITSKAFGSGRKMPIAANFQESGAVT